MDAIADWTFRFKRNLLGAARVRRTQVYCVGTAKSGTHSLCSMFSRNVRAGHEEMAKEFTDVFFRWREGRVGERDLVDWIHARDRDLALEVDSSWLNVLVIDFLVREFPKARFVLAIRNCYSWLNSEFRRVLHRPTQQPHRLKLRKFLHDPKDAAHSSGEKILKDLGLYTVDGYLSHWAAHNGNVLAVVPPERLLIVRTEQIPARAREIAQFAGLPLYSLRLHRTHEFRNPVSRDIIREIDRSFLERKVEEYCRPLMKQFFPQIQSLDDVTL